MNLGPRVFYRCYRTVPLWRRELPYKERAESQIREEGPSFKRHPIGKRVPRRSRRDSRYTADQNDQNDPTLYEHWLDTQVKKRTSDAVQEDPQRTLFQIKANMLNEYIDNLGLEKNANQQDPFLWKGLRHFGKFKPESPDEPLPLEMLLKLYEVAKAQTDLYERNLRVKQVGDILYSYGENIRLDPVNESAYIDALFSMGHRYRALELWKSRVGKRDVVNSSYWMEFGILLYLRRHDWRRAEEIAHEMNQLYGYIPPKLMIQFIRLYAKLGWFEKDIGRWYKRLLVTVENREKVVTTLLPRTNSPTSIQDPPSSEHLVVCLEELLKQNYWRLAQQVIRDLQKLTVEIPIISLLQTIDQSTKEISQKRRKKNKTNQFSNDFVPLLTELISINPQILNSSSLYQSWLRGLTAMGLVKNAMQVLDAMVQQQVGPSEDDILVLVQALVNENEWGTVWALLDRMENDKNFPDPTNKIFNVLLRTATRKEDIVLVETIVQKMGEQITQSTTTVSLLLSFYSNTKQSDKLLGLYSLVLSGKFEPSHTTWRQLWFLLRKNYQTGLPETPPAHRKLFAKMLSSPSFRPSLNVYEYAVHTMMLANDIPAALAILCHMQESKDITPTIILSTGMVELSMKIKKGSKTLFAPGTNSSQNEAIVESGQHPALLEPSVSWEKVGSSICSVMERDKTKTLAEAKRIASDWKKNKV